MEARLAALTVDESVDQMVGQKVETRVFLRVSQLVALTVAWWDYELVDLWESQQVDLLVCAMVAK